jgi:hypothetical protein
VAQSTIAVTDANGVKQTLQVTQVQGGNFASNTVIVDALGNFAVMAPGGEGAQLTSSDGTKATYRTGGSGITLYSVAAAVLLEIIGSATKTVRVKKIRLWAESSSAVAFGQLTLLRCTGASAGTPAAVTPGKHDINDPAPTAIVNTYAAAATAGAGHAVMGGAPLGVGYAADNIAPLVAEWNFATNQDKALILRGATDIVEVFNNTTTLGTTTYGFEIEWEEDSS